MFSVSHTIRISTIENVFLATNKSWHYRESREIRPGFKDVGRWKIAVELCFWQVFQAIVADDSVAMHRPNRVPQKNRLSSRLREWSSQRKRREKKKERGKRDEVYIYIYIYIYIYRERERERERERRIRESTIINKLLSHTRHTQRISARNGKRTLYESLFFIANGKRTALTMI